jgi:mannan endo-1,4-beta-mannosidase
MEESFQMKKNVLKNSLPFVLATVKAVETFAQEHDKIAAVTETGVLVGNQGNGLAKSGNKRLDWINEALAHIAPHHMAYFMTWSNFNETNFA